MSKEDNIAPEGATWVCGACGKHGKDRMTIGDESCYMWAELCKTESLQYENGRVVAGAAVTK